jgi:hypothetical protein
MMDQNEQFDVGAVLNNPDIPRIIRDEIDREMICDQARTAITQG